MGFAFTGGQEAPMPSSALPGSAGGGGGGIRAAQVEVWIPQ